VTTDTSAWMPRAFRSNIRIVESGDLIWKPPDGGDRLAAVRHHIDIARWLVILPREGFIIGAFASSSTLRAAYRAADHQRRVGHHSPERLLRQRARLIRQLRQQRSQWRRSDDLEAVLRERIARARRESMPLTHLIGTKEPMAALDVLVDQAIKAQRVALAEFQVKKLECERDEIFAAQQRLRAEVDRLRAQLAAASATSQPPPEISIAEVATVVAEETG
jgi:hypothetical protein